MNKKIVIMGAGSAGKHLITQLQKNKLNPINIIGIIDNFQEGSIGEIPIYNPIDFFEQNKQQVDEIYIAVGAQKTLKIMLDIIAKYKIDCDVYRMTDVAGKNKLELFANGKIIDHRIHQIFFSDDKPTLPYYEIPITDRCNLNCKGCLFGCNAEAKAEHIPMEEVIRDVKRMSELFCNIPWIRILGGEPLLHPDIVEIMREVRACNLYSDIDVCTNGLMIPKMPEIFFECIKEENISLHISGYPPTYKMYKQIEEKLQKYRIDAATLEREEFFKFYTLDATNDKNVSYQKCFTAACREVYKGRISNCSGVIAFEKMNCQFGTEYKMIPGEDYIEIHDEKLTGWDIMDVLDRPTNACKYCDLENMQRFEWSTEGKNLCIEDYIVRE